MGMIHIYMGDGKGKTTAAFGLALRFCSTGRQVLIAQFLKDGSSGEVAAIRQLEGIEVFSCTEKLGFTFQMDKEGKLHAKEIMTAYFNQIMKKTSNGQVALLVLDEVLDAVNTGLLPEGMLTGFLEGKEDALEVVLTGRDPSRRLLEMADYVTDMRKIKHPYEQGITARKGIEY